MQRIICCYHKVGTVLFRKIFSTIARIQGLSYFELVGTHPELPTEPDIILLPQSGYDLRQLNRPFRAIHVIRDPRDVLVSGYLYHKRCAEQWCTNRDLSLLEPIRFPRIPLAQHHRSEAWKRAYLMSLNGRSYQDNLRALSLDDGLFFELDHYAGWTIDAMLNWDYGQANVMEISFEQLHQEYTAQWRNILKYLSFSDSPLDDDVLLCIARSHDLNQMPPHNIASNDHISPGGLVKWHKYLSQVHLRAMDARFPNYLERLGY